LINDMPEAAVNVAPTEVAAFMVTLQVDVPLHAPVQPPNVAAFAVGTAVSVTAVPAAKLAVQVAPHVMPAGLLVTLPVPVPELVTVSG
jgi:hypothetical protein